MPLGLDYYTLIPLIGKTLYKFLGSIPILKLSPINKIFKN